MPGFVKDKRGVGAVEFALVAPILILLYLALVELTLGLMVSRRVDHVTAAIGDLAAQSETLTNAEINDLFEIADGLMQPFPIEALEVRLTSVKKNAAGAAEVVGSRGWAAYTTGASLDTIDMSDLATGQGLIVTDVNYEYKSPIGNFLPGLTEFTKQYRHNPRAGSGVVEFK